MPAVGYGAEYFYPGMSSSEIAHQTVGIQCGRLSFIRTGGSTKPFELEVRKDPGGCKAGELEWGQDSVRGGRCTLGSPNRELKTTNSKRKP